MFCALQSSIFLTVVSSLDILTFVVPPQLPALLTIGNIYAQRRLKKQNIFCLSNKYINGSGNLDVVCFDKVRVVYAVINRIILIDYSSVA